MLSRWQLHGGCGWFISLVVIIHLSCWTATLKQVGSLRDILFGHVFLETPRRLHEKIIISNVPECRNAIHPCDLFSLDIIPGVIRDW